MKSLAAKDKRPAPASRRTHSSPHRPLASKSRVQQENIHQIVQSKLTVGQPNDKYEAEADHVADRVVTNQPIPIISTISGSLSSSGSTQPSNGLQKAQSESGEEDQIQEKVIQRKAEKEEEKEEPVQKKLLQRKAEEEEEEKEEPVQSKLLQRQAEKEEEEEESVQSKLLQRQAEKEEEEEESVQTKLLQRKAAVDEDDEVQAMGSIPSTQVASQVINSQSAGLPIRPDVRGVLETGMRADLSAVRVHEDSSANEAAASINSKAFTHKNNIWLGAGQSQSDIHLMAHESAHVVQQGSATAYSAVPTPAGGERVQRLWNPVSAIANVVGDVVDFVADTIGDAVNYIKDKAIDIVRSMPGYSLFTVINGSDPITGESVDRNGRNFIEAGLDIIPGGAQLKEKLEEKGALDEAAQWLDDQIKEMNFNPSEIGGQLSAFWSSLSIGDVARVPTVMERLLNIIRRPVNRIIQFAKNVASKLLEIVKKYVVSSLIDFVKNQTTAYPLMTVILGRDPISGETVDRTPIALLRGFMQLSESGAEQLRQMEESGSLQRASDWLDGAIARLNLSWEELVEGFMSIWDGLGIQSLMNPFGIFRQIYETFAAPVGRIINFVIEVGRKVLKFIKDALISRLIDYARTIRGYPLLTVILGRDPFSDEPVERSAENIIHGFMCLMDGGEEQFQEMKQTGAIERLTTRIENAIATLNFTWEYIKGLFVSAWESFSLSDLAAPFDAFMRLMGIFGEPLGRLVAFVGEIVKIVIEVALKLMNFPVALVSNIITKALQAFEDIKRDPIGFLKNLLRAVKAGFSKFFDNILTHLLNGVTSWLFKELEDAGISPPADFSFQSILGFVLDVLGLSMDKIFERLALKIGQDKVDRIRGMIDRLTGIWTFVSDVMTRGPVAIWEYVQEQLSNLWNVVLEAVRNWVVTRVIERITAKLLTMLDPTGIMAVVNGFIAFYNAIQSFIAYLREMLEIVNSFVEGVAEIASGSVESAANFLEGALARGVPVVIGFLANQVGLSGLGRRIGEMIEQVRGLVDQALDWLIDKAISMGRSLLGMGGDSSSGPMDHQTMTDEISERLSAPTEASDPANAVQEKKNAATNLQNEYQPRLDDGIRLTITIDENLGEVEQDNNIDFRIRIAPNDSDEGGQSPLPGQWPTGETAADPIPIRWYKSEDDYEEIANQGPLAGVTLPRWTSNKGPQLLRVDAGNFPPERGAPFKRVRGNTRNKASEVRDRLASSTMNVSTNDYAIDHVMDLAWKGDSADNYDNLWPLDSVRNRKANSSYYQKATAMEGTTEKTKSVRSWGESKYFWIAKIKPADTGHDRDRAVNDGTDPEVPKRKT